MDGLSSRELGGHTICRELHLQREGAAWGSPGDLGQWISDYNVHVNLPGGVGLMNLEF